MPSSRYLPAAVFVAALLLLAVGASEPPPGIGNLDGAVGAQDEAVYSHIAIRMAETGSWATPMFLNRFFLYKPPLLYWLSGGAVKLFGVSALTLRLPSMLAAAAVAALVFAWVRGQSGVWRALMAVLLLAMSPLWLTLGRRNMTDAMVTMAIVVAAWILATRGPVEALSLAVAVGMLAKSIAGLIPILIAGAFWLVSSERPRLARLAVASLVGVAAAAPWFVYQWWTNERWFKAEFIGVELLAYGASAPPQTSAEAALAFYGRRLLYGQTALSLAALAAMPAFVAVLSRVRRPAEAALASSLAIMSAAILAYRYHNATYLLPLLPLLAVLACVYAPVWALGAALAVSPFLQQRQVAPAVVPPVLRAAEEYCRMGRTNGLVVVGIDDNFSISTLPIRDLRYAIQGSLDTTSQVTLDFRRMGVLLPIPEFNRLEEVRSRYEPELRAWGLPDASALGTVIGWTTRDELATLVSANASRDFLFSASALVPRSSNHRMVASANSAVLLLAIQASSPQTPQRACRL